MRQKLILIIACLCLAAYLAALGIASRQVYSAIKEHRSAAEKEFHDLVDVSTAAAVLGFMDQPFQDAVRDGVMKSRALQGAIISGPYGSEYAVERREGIIDWSTGAPRFTSIIGLSNKPFFENLRVEGMRNVTISATFYYLDFSVFTYILKNTLIMILASLAVALLTLIVSTVSKGKTKLKYQESPAGSAAIKKAGGAEFPGLAAASGGSAASFGNKTPARGKASAEAEISQRGLFSPRGNIGWEAHIQDRLSSELRRCAVFGQDLALIIMEFRNIKNIDGGLFREFAETTVNYFTDRDLIFELGDKGVAVIIPNTDLDRGFSKSEDFHRRICEKFGSSLPKNAGISIGLSSRSGRQIDADRLIFEASGALKKAHNDPVSSIVAFKSDPEKYRAFIAAKGQK